MVLLYNSTGTEFYPVDYYRIPMLVQRYYNLAALKTEVTRKIFS